MRHILQPAGAGLHARAVDAERERARGWATMHRLESEHAAMRARLEKAEAVCRAVREQMELTGLVPPKDVIAALAAWEAGG